MIDCGEGAQIRLTDFRIKRSKINQIFISHLHGDHIFGLPGLLNSFSLAGRKKPLEIFSPKGLQRMIDVIFETSNAHLNYEIIFHEVDTQKHKLVFENKKIKVYSIPLQHRVPTTGYLFKEKPFPKNIIPEKIAEHNIPFSKINDIKKGADFTAAEGIVIPNDELVFEAKTPRSYAYCSDTVYLESIIPIIKKVDLLYHEATFGEEFGDLSFERGHSTTKEAATIAQKAEVGKLLIGHFSTRYLDLNILLKESKKVFSNSSLAIEGETFKIEHILKKD